MNILLLVMTMLMLLTLMTYGRIDSFRGFSFMQTQFKEYMEKTERNYVNEEARKRYDKEKGSTKDGGKKAEKNEASSTLSFNLFVDKEQRDKQSGDLPTQIAIAKNLINFLYGDQPFFIQMEEKRPDFLDEIFNALIRITDGYTKDEKLNPKKAEEIATIDLGDIELNEVFTKMLRGTAPELESGDDDDNKPIKANPRGPFKPPSGYYSLLDFITIEKNKLKIRVFLAAPQLLMALYGNPDLVMQILDTRIQLYRDLDGDRTTVPLANTSFQRQFQNAQLPAIPADILDFGTSKTRPDNWGF